MNKANSKKRNKATFLIAILALSTIFMFIPKALPALAQTTNTNVQMMQLYTSLLQNLLGLVTGPSSSQTSSADEAPPIPGTVNPQQTGAMVTDPNQYYTEADSIGRKSFFLTTEEGKTVVKPDSVTINAGEKVNYFNATDLTQKIRVRRVGVLGIQAEQVIQGQYTHIYKFLSTGNYNLCRVLANSSEACAPVHVN